MEINVAAYGKIMFEMMTSEYKDLPKHWQSIYVKAEPLVKELIRLNNEMSNGGYEIYGCKNNLGEPILSKWDKINKAQKQLWGIKANKLKKGDLVWLIDNDMTIQENPCHVEYKHKDYVAVEIPHLNYVEKVRLDEVVLKAPSDWNEKKQLYTSDNYWLEQAAKLGL